MTEDQKIMLKNMGALSYSVETILSILNIADSEKFREDFFDKDSDVYRIYESGKNEAQYILDLKLLQMAKEGDMKAMDKIAAKARQAEVRAKENERRERRQS